MKNNLGFIALLVALSLILSACSLPWGTGGEKLKEPSDKNSPPPVDDTDTHLDPNEGIDEEQEIAIMVYFSDAQADKVAPEHRNVRVPKGKKIEEIIFEELKKGPSINGLDPVIPEGTRFLSADKEGDVLTLNLSREFIDNHIGGSMAEMMTLNSIVASYTELSGINFVQFLIEGEVQEVFIHSVLDVPIQRDEGSIKK